MSDDDQYREYGSSDRNEEAPSYLRSMIMAFSGAKRDEEDSDDFEDEEDEGNEEVDEDKACSRTKKAVPNQDQPYYHILMVEDGENNPVQHKLNVPEGNLRLTFAFSAPFTNPNIFLVFVFD